MIQFPVIADLLIPRGSTLRDALRVIDKNAQGIGFVVDESSRLVGVLSDGDIRRGLLNGVTLHDSVEQAMQREFTAMPVTTPDHELARLLSVKIRHIPLVNSENVPVDYACHHRLHRIPIMEPSLSGRELEYVTDCIKTNWISSQGRYVRSFEEVFAAFCGAERALAVSNGTVALHLALVACGVGRGDEVIVPDLTFAASVNAVLYTGATPVLADIDRRTWTLDPADVARRVTPKTRAIMPVHLYGHPCDMDAINAIAQRNNLLVIEDCAEAIGTEYKGKRVGTFGDIAAFSFFGNKTITTGEGGMVVMNDPGLHARAKMLRDHGMSPSRKYFHEEVGFNYRMTNLQGAIGVAQMERVDSFIQAKRRIAGGYNSALSKIPGLTIPPEAPWALNTYWLYTVLADPELGVTRDELMQKLLLNGVETRPTFYPLHEMPPYRAFAGDSDFPVSTMIARHGLSLPSSVTLPEESIDHITQVIASMVGTRSMMTERGE